MQEVEVPSPAKRWGGSANFSEISRDGGTNRKVPPTTRYARGREGKWNTPLAVTALLRLAAESKEASTGDFGEWTVVMTALHLPLKGGGEV